MPANSLVLWFHSLLSVGVELPFDCSEKSFVEGAVFGDSVGGKAGGN